MELSFIFYLFAAFIIIPGTFFLLVMFNKPTAGLIAAVGMLILFILFGIQFYNQDGTYKQQAVSTGSWPPYINYCPDYLSLYKNVTEPTPGTTKTELICVDTVSVAKTITANSMKTFNPNTETVATEDKIFHLYLTEAEMTAYKNDPANAGKPTDRKSILIKQCENKGLTWEGVYDGFQTLGGDVPVVPT